MRKLIHLFIITLAVGLLSSCEDDDLTTLDLNVSKAPALAELPDINLSMDNQDQALAFSWSAADYDLDLAITYKLQIAKSGTDFAELYTLYSGSALSTSVTVKDLNTAILDKLGLEAEVETSIEFRVISVVNSEVNDLTTGNKDASMQVSLTPYITSFPPIYMIGSATGGWDTALAVEVPSSAPSVYSSVWKFIQNEAFRFFAQPDWNPTSYNYPYFASGSVNSLLEDAADGDNNFKFVGETGYYRVTVNMKTLTIEMEPVAEPVMYMTGAGIGGWDTPGTGASIKMTFVKENVWKTTATFVSGEAWRFFAQADWGPTSYNFPYFVDGTVADMFEDAADGDHNFKNKSAGTYVITLDLNETSVTVVAP
ncbi:SusE domain-containing protein [Mangrovibacterium lignilyticum]|uniref:SusE domain-containing protein n=1 Tax=Mangrovibacterium lignilyticum TaxID=2668052 RepID=UPI0013D0F891|nr:SusE domain-containing protein [Mangrovibacterium lignilyticum]